MQNAKDSMFVLVEASQLSLNDDFMEHETASDKQKEFKKRLTEAIESGLSDFWAPKMDPSFSEDGTSLMYKVGKKPAVGKSYNWWEEKAKQFLPERGSHLGTRSEYVAFLGVLIKKLVASGWPMSKTWKAVCDNSKELGHYWNSENAKHDFETTGSREICGFCDLANTSKILANDEGNSGFWLASGFYADVSRDFPLAGLNHYTFQDNVDYGGVGWLVLSK